MASQIQNVHILSIEKVSVSGLSKSAQNSLRQSGTQSSILTPFHWTGGNSEKAIGKNV